MEPISLILGALAAGALRGADNTASAAVANAYGALKQLAMKRLKGNRAGELALEEHESDPVTWELPVRRALTEADAGSDVELLAVARQLSELLDLPGARSGKYSVIIQEGRGTVVGDHSAQTNYFSD